MADTETPRHRAALTELDASGSAGSAGPPAGTATAAPVRENAVVRARDRARVLLDPPERPGAGPVRTRWVETGLTFARRHPRVIDGAIAAVVLVAGLINAVGVHRPAVAIPFTVLLALPLVWRRRAPIAVFLVISAVAFVQWLTRVPLFADTALLIALYTVAFAWPVRAAVGAAVILEVGVILATVRWSTDESWPQTFVLLSGVVIAATVSGVHMRARQAYVASLLERASRLERERDQQAQLSAAAERARIAREMHDMIAHSLAVVISLANGAAAKLRRDPEQSREALESISELGRRALDDVRQLLSVLRTDAGETSRAPQPGVEEIPDLVLQAAETGLAATLAVHGEPRPIAGSGALSAYRIVQEAITNTIKHADGASTLTVGLRWTARTLEISVCDDGRPRPAVAASGDGLGLRGMSERAAISGGTVSAGRQDVGWAVTATIPTTSPAS